ncbi:MAG TPA: UDP-glucose/GDP-mannose dehydrogenase family protein [Actinomycetota bacterium]|nr:UDP-glucose/GDP-mannose dehydrogenase family protein [Actinomycetota bacterium]
MKVAVIGVGHVGLVTAATLAHFGHDVVGLDEDLSKIDSLRRGVAPFYEPGLQELLDQVVGSGKLRFTEDSAEAIAGADCAFICVGTPARADGEANLLAVENAAWAVARSATGEIVVIQKSTVPVSTADRLHAIFAKATEHTVRLVSNPEFLREGAAVQDSLDPDRILVGSDDPKAHEVMRRLYAPVLGQGCRYFAVDIHTAELAKHACNAFLALKISFANALARVCERSGADVVSVADIMGSDRRIGRDFLNAGLGYGGYCFPKDLLAFKAVAGRLGYDFGLLEEVMRINREALHATLAKIKDAVWNVESKRILLLGLSFKPGTDDIRESPSLNLARELMKAGAQVVGHDPQAGEAAARELPALTVVDDLYQGAEGAHCIVVCTDWPEYADLDLVRLKGIVTLPVIVDGRNLLDGDAVSQAGFSYLPTGRPAIN